MIKFVVCRLVTSVKGRPFSIDDKVSNLDILYLLLFKTLDALRGLRSFRMLVFVGKGCTFWGKKHMHLSQGVNIGSHNEIHGVSEEGLWIGPASSIGSHCIIKVTGSLSSLGKSIKIGSNVGIGDFAHIGGAGGVVIGDDTIAGAYLSIHPENHIFSDKDTLIREQGVTREGVHIGSNCWIGAKVTFLDGSKIGNGCVIAAGAVVRGVFPDNVVIGGVPARILKERCDEK